MRRIWTFVRSRPRLAVGALVGAISLALLAWPSARKPRAAQPGPVPEGSFDLALPTHETLDALARRYGARIDEQEAGLDAVRERIEQLVGRQEQEASRQADQFGRLQELIEETRRAVESLREDPQDDSSYAPPPLYQVEIEPHPSGAPRTFLPAGTMIEGVLLNGAYAPLRGSALPIEIELRADGIAANGATVPVARAFAIAKAQGDANSERALLQLVRIVVVTADGATYEREVDGFVTDGSGDLGVSGRLVDRIDRVALLAGGAGGLEGLANAAARTETTTLTSPLGSVEQVTGDATRYALASAAGGAAERVADVLARRIEMIEPAIHVGNGRAVVVHVLEGIDLGIPREGPHDPAAPYRAVDARY